MFRPAASNLRPANVQTIHVGAWQQGVISNYDIPRIPTAALASTYNTILTQDSVVRPAPSLIPYGAQPVGTVLGEIAEYRDTTVTPNINYRICMQVVSGVAKVYYSKDLGDWVAAGGSTTYSNTNKAHFVQINNKVMVMNGFNSLSYFDIPTKTIVPFVALSTPAAPTGTVSGGLTGSTFTITYRITANSTVGESVASTSLSKTVSTDRDMWDPSTQTITLNWTAVTSAVSYNVYMGIGGVGTEFLIASGITGLTYVDNGSAIQDNTHSYPLVDSTAGPKATRGDVINGDLWLSGIAGNIYSVIKGGTYPHTLDFTPANGGNTIPVNVGGKEIPVRVRLFRNNNGAAAIKTYCSGTNGKGKRFTLTPDSLTVGTQTISFYDVTEDSGEDGTTSPDAFIYYNDSNYYPSVDGFKTDGTLPQIQNIISTRRVSNTIQPDIATLNSDSMANCVGLGYQGRLYWAVPSNSLTNNQLWSFDLDRGGAWMKPIDVSADWMMLYNSNTVAAGGDGQIHFTVLQNNQILEFTYSVFTTMSGHAIATGGQSGQIFFSKDKRVCAKLLNVIFTFLRPVGTLNCGINGEFRNNPVATSQSETFGQSGTVVGWSEVAWSGRAWSQIIDVPTAFSSASGEVKIKVNKEVRWFNYDWNTTLAGTDYGLSDVVAEFVVTGIRDL
jgi:hypothetical protein